MNHILLRDLLSEIGFLVSQKVFLSLQQQSIQQLSVVYEEAEDDIIYQIDKSVEDLILPLIAEQAEKVGGIKLIAEGIRLDGQAPVFPKGIQNPEVLIIMDPIDGTRGIMYDKRSAFFLAAAAPYNPSGNFLQDVEVAVMVELPHSRSYLADTLWAIKGKGAERKTYNVFSKQWSQSLISPSAANTLIGGFGQISRFFPPGRDVIAAVEEHMLQDIFPDVAEGKSILFEDQYISSGGQLYQMLVGHDRFVADIRAALFRKFRKEGKKTGHVCHPYDVCATLIGEEAGLIITDLEGATLNPPLNTSQAVDWVAYANPQIKAEVQEAFMSSLVKFGIL